MEIEEKVSLPQETSNVNPSSSNQVPLLQEKEPEVKKEKILNPVTNNEEDFTEEEIKLFHEGFYLKKKEKKILM